jgi:WD40 repeat protein
LPDVCTDQTRCAIAEQNEATAEPGVTVWDLNTAQPIRRFAQDTGCRCFALSPDGTRLAVGIPGETTVQVWVVEDGGPLLSLKGHTAGVHCLAWAPDGKSLASSATDYNHFESAYMGGEVKLWDIASGSERLTLRGDRAVTQVAFSPDGRRLATLGHALRVWDAAAGQELLTFQGAYGGTIGFHSDGRLLAWSSRLPDSYRVTVWDGRPLPKPFVMKKVGERPTAIAFSTAGPLLVRDGENRVRSWDLASGKELLSSEVPAGPFGPAARSPDGRRLALLRGSDVEVVDRDPGAAERDFRLALTSDDAPWHHERVQKSQWAKQWLAVLFHLDRLPPSGLMSPKERAEIRAKARAELGR